MLICESQTGRIGGDAPGEFIIASIVTVLGAVMISFSVPFAHRFGSATLRHALILAIVALGVVMAFFYNQASFDEKHQKRLFVIHMEDVSRFSFAVVWACLGLPVWGGLYPVHRGGFWFIGALPMDLSSATINIGCYHTRVFFIQVTY